MVFLERFLKSLSLGLLLLRSVESSRALEEGREKRDGGGVVYRVFIGRPLAPLQHPDTDANINVSTFLQEGGSFVP